MTNSSRTCEIKRAPFGAIPKFSEQQFLLPLHSPRPEIIRKVDIMVYVLPLNVTSSVTTDPLTIHIDVNINVKRAFNVYGEVGRWYGLSEC